MGIIPLVLMFSIGSHWNSGLDGQGDPVVAPLWPSLKVSAYTDNGISSYLDNAPTIMV